MKTKVFAKLKPQAASLGFNTEELEGVAAQIVDNLGSEDVTEEDIDSAVTSTISYLKVAQKAANRVIESVRKKATPLKATEGIDLEPNLSGVKILSTDEEPVWFKRYRETQEKRFAAIEGEKQTTQKCKYIPNGRETKIEETNREDKIWRYPYEVVIDLQLKDSRLREDSRLFDANATEITEKKVKEFHRGQLNMKIWL